MSKYEEFRINIDLAVISKSKYRMYIPEIKGVESKSIKLLGGTEYGKILRMQKYTISGNQTRTEDTNEVVHRILATINTFEKFVNMEDNRVFIVCIINLEFDKDINIDVVQKIELGLFSKLSRETRYILDSVESISNSYYISVIYPIDELVINRYPIIIVADTKINPIILNNIYTRVIEYIYLANLIEYYYILSEIKIGHLPSNSQESECYMLNQHIQSIYNTLTELDKCINSYDLKKLIKEICKIKESRNSPIIKIYNTLIKIQNSINVFSINRIYSIRNNYNIYIILDNMRDILFEIYNIFSKIETDLNNFYININIHYENIRMLEIRFKKIENILSIYKKQSNINKHYAERFVKDISTIAKIFDKKIEMLYTVNSALIQSNMHNIQKLAILYYMFLMLIYLTEGIFTRKYIYITLSLIFITPVVYMYITILRHSNQLANQK